MRKNYHCVHLTDECEIILKRYMEEQKVGVSESINKLIIKGIERDYNSNQITSITNGMEKLLSRISYLKLLMEQLYSDFNIDEPSNPNNSIGLKTIKERANKKFDE